MKTTKLTVTVPVENFRKIEVTKKKLGITRSALIQNMIELFFRRETEAEKISRYVAGYRKKPESVKNFSGLEKVQSEILESF